MSKLPPINCVECAKEGHVATAVVRLDGDYLCLVCADGEPCLVCAKMRRERKERGVSTLHEHRLPRSPAPKRKMTVEAIGSNDPLKLPVGSAKITLKDIIDEYQKVDGIDIRYPQEEEITSRFRRRSRVDWLNDLLKAILASPTGHSEIPVPKGMKPHSLQSTLARHIRDKGLRYTAHCDIKRNSIVISNAVLHRQKGG